MKATDKIFLGDAPKDVNDLLLNKWGISLFRFAQVFAVSPVDQFLMRTDYPFSRQEIKAIRRNLKKMGDDLLERGRFVLRMTQRLGESPIKELSDDQLIKHMGLGEFFNDYIRRHRVALRYCEKVSLQGKRGSSINKKTIIAIGWGNLVSEEDRRINWKLLAQLYDWLWAQVASHKFYNELRPPDSLEEYLRKQYDRYRWAGGVADFIYKKLKVKKTEAFAFFTNFILHQFFGGKEDYLKGKLPISPDQFPKLFQNVIIYAYLAAHEGLTLLSKDQSLADPDFLWLYFRLIRLADENFSFNIGEEILSELGLSKDAPWPFKSSEIGEYIDLAIKIFLDNKVDLRSPRPLIIFPNKSHFPTSF
jgi:hypothetical protein